MVDKISKVPTNIINKSQVAFVSGQKIHDHILLTYELVRGYVRKGRMPQCMLQLNI